MKKQCRFILCFTALLGTVFSPQAQDTCAVSTFSSGNGVSTNSINFNCYSIIGQTACGISSNTTTIVKSGYFNLPIVQTAIINNAPVILSAAKDTAYKNQYYLYRARATDPDNATITFTFHNLPYGFVAQGDSIVCFSILLSTDTSFTIIASDGTLFDTLSVTLTLSLQERPFKITSPLTDTAIEDVYYVYTPASNYDNDTSSNLKYEYQFGFYPLWTTPVINARGVPVLIGTPRNNDKSTSFTIKAVNTANNSTLAMEEVTLVVVPVNDAPALQLPQSLSAVEKQEFQYQVRADDIDDTLLTFFLLDAPGGMVITPAGFLSGWTPDSTQLGLVDTVTVRVTDQSGASDTGSFLLGVVAEGIPYCHAVGPIDSIIRDTIIIPFELRDNNFDTLSISVRYLLPTGSATGLLGLIGDTASIIKTKYTDTLIWITSLDFRDTHIDSICLQITPHDRINTGVTFRTEWFAINNTPATRIATTTPSSKVSSFIAQTISVQFSGSPLDTATVNKTTVSITGSISGVIPHTLLKSARLLKLQLSQRPFCAETLTVRLSGAIADQYAKTLDGNNNNRFEGIGIDDYQWIIPVRKAGDFNGNDTLGDAVELSYLSTYWHGSASGSLARDSISRVEIGPTTGMPPYLKTLPDSVFGFEDICTYMQMWYYANGPLTQKSGKRSVASLPDFKNLQPIVLSDRLLSRPGLASSPLSATPKYQYARLSSKNNKLSVELGVNEIKNLVACEYRIFFNMNELKYQSFGQDCIFSSSDNQPLVLRTIEASSIHASMALLSSKKPSFSGKGTVLTCDFEQLGKNAGAITIAYTLVDRNHDVIESGTLTLNDENGPQFITRPIQSLVIYPNPFKSVTTNSSPSISLLHPDMVQATRLKGTAISFTIPDGFRAYARERGLTKCKVRFAIFDAIGNMIFSTPSQNILPEILAGNAESNFGIIWNGYSDKGRKCATGSYVAMCLWETDTKKGMVKKNIGVKE